MGLEWKLRIYISNKISSEKDILVNSRFLPQNMVHGSVASGIPRYLIETQNFLYTSRPTKKNLHFNKISGIFTSTLKYEKHYPQPSALLGSSSGFFCFPKSEDGTQSLGLLMTVPSLHNTVGLRKGTLNCVLFSILTLPTMSQDSRASDTVQHLFVALV